MKNVNFGELHIRQRAGRQAAQKGGPAGFSAARLYVQLIGLPCCAAFRPGCLCSPPTRRKFMLFIWKHGPPAHSALRLVLSKSAVPMVVGSPLIFAP